MNGIAKSELSLNLALHFQEEKKQRISRTANKQFKETSIKKKKRWEKQSPQTAPFPAIKGPGGTGTEDATR